MRVYVEINAVRTYISDSVPLSVIDISPVGASRATRITSRSPAQDGDTDDDQRLEPRILTLIIQGIVNLAYNDTAIRNTINRLFKATNVPIVLGIEFDDGTVRCIDTRSIGDIMLPINLVATGYLRAAITLRAGNPTFYDPNGVSVSFGLTGGGSAFTIPSFVPTFFGASILDQVTPISYAGTYKAFPVILIYGPITNPVITNLTTGDLIDFTGITIANGDYYTIDLRGGRKLVYRNGVLSDNRIGETTGASNLSTFALEPDPIVPNGNNTIKVTGTGVNTATQVYMQYLNRYDGI